MQLAGAQPHVGRIAQKKSCAGFQRHAQIPHVHTQLLQSLATPAHIRHSAQARRRTILNVAQPQGDGGSKDAGASGVTASGAVGDDEPDFIAPPPAGEEPSPPVTVPPQPSSATAYPDPEVGPQAGAPPIAASGTQIPPPPVTPSQQQAQPPPAAAATAPEPPQAPSEPEGPSRDELKAMLLDSLYGTERGLSVSSELRGEISELITQLEAANPSATPNEVEALSGQWKLVYTSNSELTALLALSKLPFVTVGDVTQSIDGLAGTVTNKVALTVPFSRTAFSSTASFEVRSPKLLNIKFERGAVATPELLQDVEFPASITVMGQAVDLSNLRDALSPLRSGLQSALAQAASFVRQQPDLKFDIPRQAQAESWLLTTYIDEDTRIARGDGGSVFVMVKEVSISSPAAASYGGGAWENDPLRNRTPPVVPPPVTPPALNVNGGDLNSY